MNGRRVELAGVVDIDAYDGLTDVSPHIGGRSVVGEIQRVFGDDVWWRGHVRVLLGVEPVAEGKLAAVHGFGGTDVTPPEAPTIEVGGVDLLERLRALDGREVLLVIEDADP